MRGPSKLARSAAVLFSLSLLTAYVWHSHVTPNTPPPDPLTLSFDGRNAGTGNELRIISSKVINQPVFSLRKTTAGVSEAAGVPVMYVRPMMAGSKSGPVHFFGLHAWRQIGFFGYQIALSPYSDAAPDFSPPSPFPDFSAKVSFDAINRSAHEARDSFGPSLNAADPFALPSNTSESSP